jgi:hypothetical protein
MKESATPLPAGAFARMPGFGFVRPDSGKLFKGQP